MRRYPAGVLSFLVVLAIAFHFGFPLKTKAGTSEATGRPNPVLVELFTSEGCSSCPPADLLLQKLVNKQPVAGAEVIAIEEHVDYWNHLGWADPYSSSKWSGRQSDYAATFGNDAYTPELVVDGLANFVGSNARQAETEIGKAARLPKTDIAIEAERMDEKDKQSFSISVAKIVGSDAGGPAEVWLAVTEDGLHSSVDAGENIGRVLNHVATLRSLQNIGVADPHQATISYAGISRVKLDPGWNPEKLRVVVFVQENKSRRILGAASVPLKN